MGCTECSGAAQSYKQAGTQQGTLTSNSTGTLTSSTRGYTYTYKPATKVNIGGTWKNSSSIKVNIGGTWKTGQSTSSTKIVQ